MVPCRIRLRNDLDKAQQLRGKNRHSRIAHAAAKSKDKMRRNISMVRSLPTYFFCPCTEFTLSLLCVCPCVSPCDR